LLDWDEIGLGTMFHVQRDNEIGNIFLPDSPYLNTHTNTNLSPDNPLSMDLETLQGTVPKTIDPQVLDHSEVNNQIKNIVTVDLDTVSMVMFVDASDCEALNRRTEVMGQESAHEMDRSLHTFMFNIFIVVDEMARVDNSARDSRVCRSLYP
jgi:hypothetical protein